MYLRMLQGYLASGDAYTQRYDEIIKDIPCKVKIIDDTLLYDSNIKEAFYHIFDFPLYWAKNGIVQKMVKFQFCQDVVKFGGFQITHSGVTPSESMVAMILNFPIPRTLTDARLWFGLVNQVAWVDGQIDWNIVKLYKRNTFSEYFAIICWYNVGLSSVFF